MLITSAGSDLCHAVAEQLSDSWRVQVTGSADTDPRFPFSKSDVSQEDSINTLLEGIHAVVHLAVSLPEARGTELMDYRTRQTYRVES